MKRSEMLDRMEDLIILNRDKVRPAFEDAKDLLILIEELGMMPPWVNKDKDEDFGYWESE